MLILTIKIISSIPLLFQNVIILIFFLGTVHAGMGCTALNKLLACLNIPTISSTLFKRYEREIGPALEERARESCKQAAEEERQLVIDNIINLSKELNPLILYPPEIVQEIYLFMTDLQASNAENISSLDCNNNTTVYNPAKFDLAVGQIVNIILSYDMGWSKRGNGRSYDSLNGYGTVIGFLSKKILDFSSRNRKCRLCDLGHKKDDHDCRKNFEGSAKAMEPDVGAQLLNNSTILQNASVSARVLIGDEDSSTIANVRRNIREKIFKLADKNHLNKHFVNELYGLQKQFTEIKQKKNNSASQKIFWLCSESK
ncbi:GSCOCG00012233001-RA-CDS [Cotesia congregata]|nr:GSCOCG00012233001-RA-CDS [Cotesia congregata]